MGICRSAARPPLRVLIIGLDAAGKSTVLQLLAKGSLPVSFSSPPTEGFNAEFIRLKGVEMTVWDVGGQDMLRRQWIHYYNGVDGLVFVIDSTDHDRLGLAKEELMRASRDDQLLSVPLVILANKQDSPFSLSSEEITTRMGLDNSEGIKEVLGERSFTVFGTCARNGDGVVESFDWLCSKMKPR